MRSSLVQRLRREATRRLSRPLSAIRSVVVSPRHTVRVRVVDAYDVLMSVDGREGDRFESVGPPTFSADGAHVAYLGKRAGAQWLIVDGRAERAWPSAVGLVLAPNGKRSAYVAGSA